MLFVHPCLPWSLKRLGELGLQIQYGTLLFSHQFDLETVTYNDKPQINHCCVFFFSFLVHPEQLPPRPWITLKERDQILPSGKTVVLFPAIKQ